MNNLITKEDYKITVNNDFLEQFKNFKRLQLEIELKEKELKQELIEFIETNIEHKEDIINNLAFQGIKVIYKAPSKKNGIDNNKLKKDGIYKLYLKESDVKSSIIIEVF